MLVIGVNVGGSDVVVVVVLLVNAGGAPVGVSVGVVVDMRAGTGVVVLVVVRVLVMDAGVDDGVGVVVSFGDVGVVNGAESTDGVDVCGIPAPKEPVRTVALDEKGRDLSSEKLAEILGDWRDGGIRETRFVIGAADGHSDEDRANADLVLGFGKATWPHLLVRAMLAEQIYRATSILAGHPYHRAG